MSPGTSDDPFERTFPARSEALREIRAAVRGACRERGASEDCTRDVVIAVDEACQNIIRHGYRGEEGDLELRIERAGERLRVSIIDYAPPCDPDAVRGRALSDLRPGGLGTHFMREAMDAVEFEDPPRGCGNLLRMERRIR